MPTKVVEGQVLIRPRRWPDVSSVERVVLTPVVELVANSRADLKVKFRGYRDIAPVEEGVKVASQQETVVDSMGAARRVGPYVSCFEHGEDSFARNGAAALVRVSDNDPERPLAKTRADCDRVAVTRRFGLVDVKASQSLLEAR
jgi:hypothetical protein